MKIARRAASGGSRRLNLSASSFSGIAGTKYYVDPTVGGASDANNGTSTATPWLTVAHAATATLVAGDTCFIKSGTAYAGALTMSRAGSSAAAPVTYTSFGVGVAPVLCQNIIRNPGMKDLVVGTPGTLATNWGESLVSPLTRAVAEHIVPVGSGRDYVDMLVSGTPGSSGQVQIRFDTAAPCSASTTFVLSAYLAFTGSLTNVSNVVLAAACLDAGGALISTPFTTTAITLTGSLVRYQCTATTPVGTVSVRPYLGFDVTSGQAINVTPRIQAPIFELGTTASTYGTSVNVTGAFVTLNNLKIGYGWTVGVNCGATDTSLYQLEITNSSDAIQFSQANGTAIACWPHDLHLTTNTTTANQDEGANAFSIFGSSAGGITIAYNKATNCIAPSHNYGWDGGFIAGWQQNDNITIRDNYANQCEGFIEPGASPATTLSNWSIFNNVINFCGILTWINNSGGFACTPQNWVYTYNTVYSDGTYPRTNGYIVGSTVALTATGQMSFDHNLFKGSNVNGPYYPGVTNLAHTNNFYNVNSGAPSGTGETTGTATFTDQPNGDLHTSGGAASYGAYANGGVASAVWPNPSAVYPNAVAVGTVSGHTGTLSLGGTYASLFCLNGSTLNAKGPTTRGSFDITITDSGLGLTTPFTITAV